MRAPRNIQRSVHRRLSRASIQDRNLHVPNHMQPMRVAKSLRRSIPRKLSQQGTRRRDLRPLKRPLAEPERRLLHWHFLPYLESGFCSGLSRQLKLTINQIVTSPSLFRRLRRAEPLSRPLLRLNNCSRKTRRAIAFQHLFHGSKGDNLPKHHLLRPNARFGKHQSRIRNNP